MKKSFLIGTWLMLLSFAGLQAQSMQEGTKAIDRLELEKARQIFNALIQKEPGKAENYYFLGNIHILNGKYDSAKQVYARGMQANANEPLIHVGMGRYYLNEDKKNEARQEFEKALELSKKKDAFVMQQIADAYVQVFSTADGDYAANIAKMAVDKEPKNATYMLTYGDALRVKGEGGQGLTAYETAARLDPKSAGAPTRIGDFYMKLKNYDAAKKTYDQAVATDPTYPPVYKSLGEYFYYTGQTPKALESYEKFLSLVGTSPSERIRYAGFLFFAKKYEEALKQLDIARRSDPDNLLLLRLSGYNNVEIEKGEEAVIPMEKFFALAKPANIIGKDHIYYGKALSMTGKDSLAIISYEKGLELDSSDLNIYNDIAKIYNDQKKYDKAAATMETKLVKSVNSLNAQDYYTLGTYYYNDKNYPLADSAFKKVNEYYPAYVFGYVLRARTQFNLDDKNTGSFIPYYEKVIEVIGNDTAKYTRDLTDANMAIAFFYLDKKKDYRNARIWAEKVLAIDPKNKQANDIIEYVNALKKAGKCTNC